MKVKILVFYDYDDFIVVFDMYNIFLIVCLVVLIKNKFLFLFYGYSE